MRRTCRCLCLIVIATISACTDFVEEVAPQELSLNSSSFNISRNVESFQVTVRCGTIWNIENKPSWIDVNGIGRSASSLYEWDVYFTAQNNYDYNREGIISFSVGSQRKNIIVNQEGIKGRFIPVESVSLSPNELVLSKGKHVKLSYSILPSNASNQGVAWESTDPSVATVDYGGLVETVAPGVTTIIVMTRDGGKTATCKVTVTESSLFITTPEVVDLGLPSGTKWGSFNLGATKPEEYGDFFAWGETEPYYKTMYPLVWKDGKTAGYDSPSYKWCTDYSKLTKYCTDSSWGDNGFTDSKTLLDANDDAAFYNLGGSWRIPTETQWVELYNRCSITWTTQGGKNGYRVTSRTNGKSIFLPAAGLYNGTVLNSEGSWSAHWSASLGESDSYHAYSFAGNAAIIGYRWFGLPIRPVTQ